MKGCPVYATNTMSFIDLQVVSSSFCCSFISNPPQWQLEEIVKAINIRSWRKSTENLEESNQTNLTQNTQMLWTFFHNVGEGLFSEITKNWLAQLKPLAAKKCKIMTNCP